MTVAVYWFIIGLAHINKKTPIRILEIGMGTGLNAILSYQWAKQYQKQVYYHTLEPYPIPIETIAQLNYPKILDLSPSEKTAFQTIHQSHFEHDTMLCKHFSFTKYQQPLQSFDSINPFDLIYFDAF